MRIVDPWTFPHDRHEMISHIQEANWPRDTACAGESISDRNQTSVQPNKTTIGRFGDWEQCKQSSKWRIIITIKEMMTRTDARQQRLAKPATKRTARGYSQRGEDLDDWRPAGPRAPKQRPGIGHVFVVQNKERL